MLLLQRDAQIAKLDAAIAALADGRGGVVQVEGVAGIGKSTLLTVAADHAGEQGARVLRARASELEHEFAWGLVRQLFEPLLLSASDEERERWFAGAAGASRTLFDSAEQGSDSTPFALVHGLYWLAANIAVEQPLVLIVDDLHWGDAPSLRWIAHLGPRLADLPVLAVGGTRPATAALEPELIAALLEEADAEIVWPAPLTPAATRELIEASADGAVVDDAFVTACHEATGGNPLYLRAVVESLRADGIEPSVASVPHVRSVAPEAVSRTVAKRLGALGDDATAYARAVAIVGDRSETTLIAEAAQLDEQRANAAWDELVAAGVLRQDTLPEFTHPVVRQSVYSAMPPGQRATLHGAAATTLMARGASAERVAAQLLEVPAAQDPARADLLISAARDARRRGAADVALTLFERAVAEVSPDATGRAELLLEVGQVAQQVHRPAAVRWLTEALDACSDPALGMRISIELVGAEFYRGEEQRAAARLDAVLTQVEASGAPARTVDRLRALLLQVSMGLPEWNERREELLAPLRELSVDELVARGPELASSFAYAEARILGIDAAQTIELVTATLADGSLLASHSDGTSLPGAFQLLYAESWEQAERWYGQLLAAGRRDGTTFSIWIAQTLLARVYIATGRIEAALQTCAESHELVTEHGVDLGKVATLGVYAEALIEAGRLDEAAERVATIDQYPDTIHTMYGYEQRARIALIQGRPKDALADHERIERLYSSLGVTNPGFVTAGPTAALAHTFLGDRDAGLELAEREVERARRWGAPRTLSRALRSAAHVRDDASSEALLLEALQVASASDTPAEVSKAHFIYGMWLRRANRTDEAKTELAQALDIAATVGASHLETEIRRELLATGARPRRTAVSGVAALTPSELRVARLASAGRTNREIAQELFVTTKTVEVHLSAAYRKLGLRSRSQLAEALETATLRPQTHAQTWNSRAATEPWG